jgi:hypothetical protein
MWQQLRRRRVTRVVAAYAAFSFAFVEAALFIVPYLVLPPWSIRVAWGLVVIGFPLAVVLAWTYDLTPVGIVRTPEDLGPEAPQPPVRRPVWLVLSTLALVGGLMLHFLRSSSR